MNFPVRKRIDHRGPLAINPAEEVYFVTVVSTDRGGTAMADAAGDILDAARFYHQTGKWFLHIMLVMPDHVHALLSVPQGRALADLVGHWKSYLATRCGVRFQHGFYDTRIRDDAHYEEKWNYICRNPVARGLVTVPKEWPHSIAFDRETGTERPHR